MRVKRMRLARRVLQKPLSKDVCRSVSRDASQIAVERSSSSSSLLLTTTKNDNNNNNNSASEEKDSGSLDDPSTFKLDERIRRSRPSRRCPKTTTK